MTPCVCTHARRMLNICQNNLFAHIPDDLRMAESWAKRGFVAVVVVVVCALCDGKSDGDGIDPHLNFVMPHKSDRTRNSCVLYCDDCIITKSLSHCGPITITRRSYLCKPT